MSGVNGDHVTRAELAAHIDPMKEDIKEISRDLKALLADRAAARELREVAKSHDSRRLALFSLCVAGFSSLWWVPEALAKLTH